MWSKSTEHGLHYTIIVLGMYGYQYYTPLYLDDIVRKIVMIHSQPSTA